jgi:hypothetical protein
MRKYVPIVFLTVVTSFFATGCSQQVSFSQDVKPILDANCLDCHDGVGEGSKRTDYLVTSYDNVMKGTKYGPVVEPGNAISSTLYRVVSHSADPEIQMPPHHKQALADGRSEPLKFEEIGVIKDWIDQGARNN